MWTSVTRHPVCIAIVVAFLLLVGRLPFVMAETINYTYDQLNRLIKVEYEDGSTIEYAYDEAGNRLAQRMGPPLGSICTRIKPQEAVKAGAQWKVDGGGWKNSGATVSSLGVGQHKVELKAISGWTTPPPQTVTVEKDKTKQVTATYIQQTGSLMVTLTPKAAIVAGAMWKVDDLPWKKSGSNVSGLAVGKHTVQFKKIKGWKAPANLTVSIKKSTTTRTTGKYVQQRGQLDE